jgi:hypothetical protein
MGWSAGAMRNIGATSAPAARGRAPQLVPHLTRAPSSPGCRLSACCTATGPHEGTEADRSKSGRAHCDQSAMHVPLAMHISSISNARTIRRSIRQLNDLPFVAARNLSELIRPRLFFSTRRIGFQALSERWPHPTSRSGAVRRERFLRQAQGAVTTTRLLRGEDPSRGGPYHASPDTASSAHRLIRAETRAPFLIRPPGLAQSGAVLPSGHPGGWGGTGNGLG